MRIINKLASKIGLRKPRYRTLMVRREDYLSFKAFAAQQKMTHVDFQHELLTVYLECKKKKHEAIIAALERKQDALVDELKLYLKRFGKIYRFPGSNTSKSS